MKKRLALILLSIANLQAAETGDAAVATAETAKDNHWQNWTFVGTAAVTAAAAVFLVSLDHGSHTH